MDDELYYHRVFWKIDRPSKFSDEDILVEPQMLFFFIIEVIDFAFRSNNVRGWAPLYDLDRLRADNSNKSYFNSDIGWAVCHHCAMDDAWLMATHEGFDVNKWLELPGDTFKNYTHQFLGLVIDKTKPVNVSIINGLAFTWLMARKAVENNKRSVVSRMIWDVVCLFKERFPFEWIYYDLQQWVQAYKVRHEELHRL
ncbi:hypothetical protein AVEN_44831-1 [Araneus ventricosus]|uniref:Uncharacterized protein n=1 Tax=Araneus ventricosus TaxID=182803 RepID=A0A4Y2CJV3_ARAVE|nr:hypothetical protein AVEN_44831-1 [Araneus ventricosus]